MVAAASVNAQYSGDRVLADIQAEANIANDIPASGGGGIRKVGLKSFIDRRQANVQSQLAMLGVSSHEVAPTVTTVILPQVMQGISGTNSTRVPFAYRARVSGLLPNATYRFFNQVVTSSDAATVNGAGNCIFVSESGNFIRTTNPSLATPGAYRTFTTDAAGTFEGWFITEPTGNARFVPGNYLFMRIALNDGGAGTTVTMRLTTADSVRVVKLDASTADSTGTGLRGTSGSSPKDFVFAYDNVNGAGRPIAGSFVEDDGTANTVANNYAAFYGNSVNGINGAFGMVVPNVLPNGIRRVERRSLTQGAVVSYAADADGIWPSGANTVNPSGGTTEIVLTASDLTSITSVRPPTSIPDEFLLSQNYPNPFNPSTTIRYEIPQAGRVVLKVFDVLGREVITLVEQEQSAGAYRVQWDGVAADGSRVASGFYVYRLTSGGSIQSRVMMLMK
jgi:hypothetical protein